MKPTNFLLAILCFAVSITATAKVQTPTQALQKFKTKALVTNRLIDRLSFVETIMTETNSPMYVYSDTVNKKGFVILAADDMREGVIGYSEKGSFDSQNMPEALKMLLKSNRSKKQPVGIQNKNAIAPLLSTKWNQTEPYNNITLSRLGTLYPTGCVGTALAQIVNYYKYPARPVGSKSYYWPGGMKDIDVDYSEFTFDYDNLIDDYQTGEPTEEQIKAVNDLMYCCATAVEADWDKAVTNASDNNVPNAMKTHFGYSEYISKINSTHFSIEEWSELLYSQLSKGLPVLICANLASTYKIGHAIICDGYDGDGFFHINWGWGGNYDGYYNLASLYTADPEVDFSTEGYGTGQVIFINLFPQTLNVAPEVVCTSSTFSASYRENLNCLWITCDPSLRYSSQALEYGVKFEDVNSGNIIYAEKGTYGNIYSDGWNQTVPEDLADGTYKITPAFYICETNTWKDIHTNLNKRIYYVDVAGNNFKVYASSDSDKLMAINSELPEVIFSGRSFSAKTDLVNPGKRDISADIIMGICEKRTDGTYKLLSQSSKLNVKLEAGETRSAGFTLEDYYYTDDRYIGFFQYSNYEWVLIGTPVQVPLAKYTQGTLVLDDVTIERYPTRNNSILGLNAVFHCEDGYYNDRIFMDLAECDENGVLLQPYKVPKHIRQAMNENESYAPSTDSNNKVPSSQVPTITRNPRPVHISGQIEGNVVGQTPGGTVPPSNRPDKYIRPVFISDGDNDMLFILGNILLMLYFWDNNSGIPDVTTDTNDNIIYYDLHGRKISDVPASSGVYIKVDGSTTSKVVIR